MYFKNRAEAGRKLAALLKQYDNQQCVVIALNPGGVLIGAQIAMNLHTSLMVLDSEDIHLPGERQPLATLTTRTMSYNSDLTSAQIDEWTQEYHGLIEEQRIASVHRLNRLLADGGEIDPKFLRRHIIILVTDVLHDGAPLNVAADFLKPIKIKKLVIATPLASVMAVDKMHLMGDDIYCLNVSENLMNADHYFDDNYIPDRKGTLKIMRNISLNWELVH